MILSFAMALYSCKSNDPIIPNEEELITNVNLTLVSEDGKDTLEWSFEDLDGAGGEEPIISVSTIKVNTTYNTTVSLSNEAVDPALNITEEVEEEGRVHQFFYVVAGPDLAVAYNDKDEDGNPIGINTIFKTGKESDGDLKLVLRHEPIKPNNGDPINAEGETDIEVTFYVSIL